MEIPNNALVLITTTTNLHMSSWPQLLLNLLSKYFDEFACVHKPNLIYTVKMSSLIKVFNCFGIKKNVFVLKKQIYDIWMIHENYPLHADVSSSMNYGAAKYFCLEKSQLKWNANNTNE